MIRDWISDWICYIKDVKDIKRLLPIIAIALTILIITICIIVVCFGYKVVESSEYNIITLVKENNVIWEVRCNKSTLNTELYRNGELNLDYEVNKKSQKSYMKLDNIQKEDIINIRETYKVGDNGVYSIDIHDSSRYIEYLKQDGYKIVREAYSQNYIELFMKKDGDLLRVIIFKDSLIEAKMGTNSLPDIKYYFVN